MNHQNEDGNQESRPSSISDELRQPNHEPQGTDQTYEIPIQAIQLGDNAIVTLPGSIGRDRARDRKARSRTHLRWLGTVPSATADIGTTRTWRL